LAPTTNNREQEYLTQQHRNSNNSPITRKIIASKHSCKVHQQNPLKIKLVKKHSPPLRASQGTWARSNVEEAHSFAEHLANVFQPHPSEKEPEEEALTQLLETPTNTNHQSTVSKELKFKKSSTA
jgi:hypothetical protein